MDEARMAVVVRRDLPVSAGRAFDEWLDAEALAAFITPAPSRTGRVEWAPRVGGTYLIEMVDAATTVRISGEFLELERPSRLRFTWNSTYGDGFESVVTVTFEPLAGDRTSMTIDHELLPAAVSDDHQSGWIRIAGQLATRFR
jgi:uncharacterized protein YndB with AHSA1/START domain